MFNNPWFMLAILFVARTSTGYAFQSIGSSGPAIAAALAIDFALIGSLIGLFKVPGIFLSLPSSMLGRMTSDRMLISIGLVVTAAGCAVTAGANSYEIAATGRFITGIGATLTNLYFTKATLDWFAGSKNLPLATAFLVNSWPLGIALGLMTQGPMTLAWGWQGAMLVSTGFAVLTAGLMIVLYREAPDRTVIPVSGLAALKGLSREEWIAMFLIGTVWSILNVGLAVVFGFSPALLTSLGYDLADAGRLVSLGTWIGILAIPAGGMLAARTGRSRTIIFVCTSGGIIVYTLLGQFPGSSLLYAIFGVIGFAAAGPIMAEPSRLLLDENRAAGMGIFYTVYYANMGLMPAFAGMFHDVFGPRAPLVFVALLMVVSILCQLALFRRPGARAGRG